MKLKAQKKIKYTKIADWDKFSNFPTSGGGRSVINEGKEVTGENNGRTLYEEDYGI